MHLQLAHLKLYCLHGLKCASTMMQLVPATVHHRAASACICELAVHVATMQYCVGPKGKLPEHVLSCDEANQLPFALPLLRVCCVCRLGSCLRTTPSCVTAACQLWMHSGSNCQEQLKKLLLQCNR